MSITANTPDAVRRKRQIAQMLARSVGKPRDIGQGIQAVMAALGGRMADRQANRMEEQMPQAPQMSGAPAISIRPQARPAEMSAPRAPAVQGGGGSGILRGGGGADTLGVNPVMAPENEGGAFFRPGHAQAVRSALPFRRRDLPPAQRAEWDAMSHDEQINVIRRMEENPGMSVGDAMMPEGADDMRNNLGGYEEGSLQGGGGQNAMVGGDGNDTLAAFDVYKLLEQEPQYDLSDPRLSQKLRESDAKNIAYLRKAMIANAMLEDPRLTQAMTRMDNTIASKLGGLGRLYTNSDYELGNLAANLFATSILRKESGAQTPEPEVERYRRMYAPLANETEAELKAKAALRAQEIRALQMSLGEAGPVGEMILEEIEALRRGASSEMSDDDFLKELGLQ